MYGIIVYHHFSNNMPSKFVELPSSFTSDNYFYDLVNNIQGRVSGLSLAMDFCFGHLGNGGNILFMTITGYFLFGRKISFPRRIRTVANILYAILFHGIVLTVINFYLLKNYFPFSSYGSFRPIFTLPNWFSTDNLWYLQVYGLFILLVLPLLKLFEDKLTQQTHLCLVLALVFINFLSFRKYLPNIWLSTMMEHFIMGYYLGGYVSKYKPRIRTGKLLLAALIYLAAYFTYEYSWRYSCMVAYKSPLQYSYVAVMQPFVCVVIYTFLLFMITVNCKGPSGIFSKILGSVSASTIGIYIFHYNFISISFIIADTFWWKDWTQKGYFLFILIDSLFLLLAGYLIDLFRRLSYKRFETALDQMLERAK